MTVSNEPTFQAPPPPPMTPPMPQEEPPAPRPTKLMIAGIVVFVLGLLLVIATVAKLVTGTVAAGGFLCLAGVVLVALSFIRLPSVPQKEGPLS